MGEITFRLLEKQDLPLLHKWLNEPHMRRYYQPEPIAFEEVSTKYSSRIEGVAPAFCHLALLDGMPFGKFQCYKNVDWPEYASEIDLWNGVSIDYFIGDPSLLGRGLGKQMISKYVKNIVLKIFKDENICYIAHDNTNLAAIKSTEAAGFYFVREVIEKNIPQRLYQISR